MVNTLFFDFYGTIAIYGDMEVGEEETWRIIYNYIIENGKSISYEEFINKWKETFKTNLKLDDLSHETVLLTKIAKVLEYFGVETKKEKIRDIGINCLENWHKYISFPQELNEVLRELSDRYSLVLVSNFDHPPYLLKLLKDTNIYDFFDDIIISGDLGINKPDPEIFRYAIDKMGVMVEEVVFIGDSISADIKGAENIGCHTVLIDFSDRYPEYQNLKINSLSEILDLKYCSECDNIYIKEPLRECCRSNTHNEGDEFNEN